MSTTVDEQQVVEKEVALPSGPGWDVKLTYEQTLAGLKELAAERPDHVYEIVKNEAGAGFCRYIEYQDDFISWGESVQSATERVNA